MNFLVIDTETTGHEEDPCVVEVAGVLLNDKLEFVEQWSGLVRPTKPILPEAQAVHHISVDEVANSLGWQETRRECLKPMMDQDTILVAHNTKYDSQFFQNWPEGWNNKWLCTLRLTRRLLEEGSVKNYQLQYLSYALKLPRPTVEGSMAHRALYDTQVCVELFRHLVDLFLMRFDKDLSEPLQPHHLAALLELERKPQVQTICSFGKKYYGEPWASIPKGYLHWMQKNVLDMDEDLSATVTHWLKH